MLPSSSRDGFGKISTRPFVNLPIRGVAGDQQASLFGHCCFCEKEAKCTFGTGAFYLSNEGERLRPAPNGLLATIGYQLEGKPPIYAHEGSVSSAGSALEWLVKVGVTPEYHAIDRLVEESGNTSSHVTLIPAFSGLFCPHWRPDARAVILGLSFSTDRGNICCAALEAIAMQVNDLLDATSS